MISRKKLLITAFSALTALSAMATTATFDWAEASGNWWTSYGYSETNNGVVMASSGRATTTTVGGGSALMVDYAQDTNSGSFGMSEGGSAVEFVVQSIDISARAITTAGGDVFPTVQGTFAGSVVWTITPATNVSFVTYTAADTGDLSSSIDTIVWNTGEAVSPGANYENKIDNLVVNTATVTPGAALFDWEEFAENWWTGYGYSETNNGIVMTSGGRATGSHGGDGPGGTNGVAFKSDYNQDLAAGTFSMSESGAAIFFVVNSIDISANGLGEYTPTVQGKAGGAVVWTIIPTEGVGLATYTSATSGDMTAPIDGIVWNTGEAAAPGANYQNQIDNLSIQKSDPPAFEEGAATFDWEEFAGNWWVDGYNYTETENNITMVHGGRTTASDGGDGTGGANGVALKAAYVNDLDPGFITMQQGGADVWFVVESIDIEANAGIPAEFTPSVQGEADGVILWEIIPATNAGLVTYTAATTGDMSAPIERIIWNTGQHSSPGTTFNNTIDNLSITTSLPALEIIYDWNLGGFWTPHALYSWNLPNYGMDLLNFDQYWWSGGDTTGTPTVIKHRPGLADLPASGGFGGIPNDTNVGGLGNRGLWATNQVRTLVTNETLRISYDWKMFVNGSDNGRFIDMFFSTTGDQAAKRFGQTGTELGFAWYQTATSNDVAITFAADDDWMGVIPPVLRIPLTGLGIDVGTADHDGDELAITYTAKKTTTADTWLCGIAVSNKASGATYSVEDVVIVNATVYSSPTYYCVYTADDLSDGDAVSGANPAGYEIGALRVAILLDPGTLPVVTGWEQFMDDYGLVGGPYDDDDNDGIDNVTEFALNGDPNVPVAGDTGIQLPYMVYQGDYTDYFHVQQTNPDAGITYIWEHTGNLETGPWVASEIVPTNYPHATIPGLQVYRRRAWLSTENEHFFRLRVTQP